MNKNANSYNSNARLSSYLHLLHISDPLLPIGGFTHSLGLETYVQKELVNGNAAVKKYLLSYLRHNYLYNDLLAMRLAWDYTFEDNLEGIIELSNILSAAKAPMELRNASTKLGLRFLKIIEAQLITKSIFINFLEVVKKGICESNYCVVYGLAACLLDIGRDETMCALTYGTASTIINNCAKLIPISQMEGQKILFESHNEIEVIINKAKELKPEEVGLCSIGFDIRSMQHERLYTRIYIS